jgi:hypothetical protein
MLIVPIDEAMGETSVVVDGETVVSDPPVLPLLAQAVPRTSRRTAGERLRIADAPMDGDSTWYPPHGSGSSGNDMGVRLGPPYRRKSVADGAVRVRVSPGDPVTGGAV